MIKDIAEVREMIIYAFAEHGYHPQPHMLQAILGKCTEELGEAAKVINKPHEEHPEPLFAEVCDLIIVASDLAYMHLLLSEGMELTPEEFSDIMQEKIKEKSGKWLSLELAHLPQKGE